MVANSEIGESGVSCVCCVYVCVCLNKWSQCTALAHLELADLELKQSSCFNLQSTGTAPGLSLVLKNVKTLVRPGVAHTYNFCTQEAEPGSSLSV